MASVAITVKGAPRDTLPLAPGLVTTIEATLGAATRAAGTVALSSVELTKLVASALPSSDTCEPDTKLTPLTARLKAAAPASTEAGEGEPIAGPTTFNGSALEAAAPGLTTCTLNWPVLDTRLAGTIAVSELGLTNVVASAVEFNETCEPEVGGGGFRHELPNQRHGRRPGGRSDGAGVAGDRHAVERGHSLQRRDWLLHRSDRDVPGVPHHVGEVCACAIQRRWQRPGECRGAASPGRQHSHCERLRPGFSRRHDYSLRYRLGRD